MPSNFVDDFINLCLVQIYNIPDVKFFAYKFYAYRCLLLYFSLNIFWFIGNQMEKSKMCMKKQTLSF